MKHNYPLSHLYIPKKVGSKNILKNITLESQKKEVGRRWVISKSGEQKWGVVGNEQKNQR